MSEITKKQRKLEEFEPQIPLDDLLRRMLSTPPKPHKKPEKSEQKKKTAE